jgi:CheY-like chemotaxis protein
MQRPRILSVDDEPGFTETLKLYFEPRGYAIDSASSGTRAIELLKEKEYDVVLLDLKMEGMNGDEVMRRSGGQERGLRYIFVTAYMDPGTTRERVVEEGAYAFMDKPLESLGALEKLVNEAFLSGKGKGRNMILRLLIVDDEPDICDFVKNFFKERNFDVLVAHDGKRAIETVKTRRPEIILLDLRMPVMGGLDALKEIREIDGDSKVVVVTAVEDAEMADEAKRQGAVDYITKPLLLEQLERTVLTIAEQIRSGKK